MLEFWENWKNEEGKEKLAKWVLDPENLLTSKKGLVEGVYAIDVVECVLGIKINAYVGQIGFIPGEKSYVASTIRDRLLQHLKAWIGGSYVEYWTGVSEYELVSGKYKFQLSLLQEEKDVKKRKKIEEQYILKRKPYLQYSPYRKYPSNYEGLDLCIIPWRKTRRAAFLDRVNELCSMGKGYNNYIMNTSWDKNWDQIAKKNKPSEDTIRIIEQQIPKYSEVHEAVKAKIDQKLGVSANKRGCTYKYLVSLFAKAYEDEWKSNELVS